MPGRFQTYKMPHPIKTGGGASFFRSKVDDTALRFILLLALLAGLILAAHNP